MAVVRNITPDDLVVGDRSAPAGEEVEIPNEELAGRAWPTSTWELVTKPGKGYHRDSSVEDAIVYHSADAGEATDSEESA